MLVPLLLSWVENIRNQSSEMSEITYIIIYIYTYTYMFVCTAHIYSAIVLQTRDS